MVKIIKICVVTLFLLGCVKQHKYKIVGSVLLNDTLKDAVWYTDTIRFKGDTAYYINSNKSIVNIVSPYVIYEIY